ncbi:MAG: hypothetical protein HRF43_07875, partial [Phycisphaerae bacterium]
PQFPQVLSEGDLKLRPIRLARHADKSLIAPAAGSGEQPAGTGGTQAGAGPSASTSERIPIDDSTPESLASGTVAVLAAMRYDQLAEILVAEQRAEVEKALAVLQPINDAELELNRVLAEKFPGHSFKVALPKGIPGLFNLPREATIADFKSEGDDEAEATMTSQGRDGASTSPVKFRRIEGKWRIEIAALKPMSQVELDMVARISPAMVEPYTRLIERINNGEITEATAAEEACRQALGESVKKGLEQATSQSPPPGAPTDQATPPAEGSAPTPEARTPEPTRPRERDEVDQSYSGPGMLRQR